MSSEQYKLADNEDQYLKIYSIIKSDVEEIESEIVETSKMPAKYDPILSINDDNKQIKSQYSTPKKTLVKARMKYSSEIKSSNKIKNSDGIPIS